MKALGIVSSILIIIVILLEAFETIVLPRRVSRRLRLTRVFFRSTWLSWSAFARRISSSKRREAYLGFYGPLSLILILCVWAVGLIIAFAMLQWAIRSPLSVPEDTVGFGTYLYMSGTTFFTLGLGDVTPLDSPGRAVAVIEPGIGFLFLALIIGYIPVIYQAFSRREVNISLLDARAGSPPTAGELLSRHGQNLKELGKLLRDWERWSADLMESHLSYPVLCYYRSQHDNQSWLTALTAILDASALVIVGVDGASRRQAQLTFAMARHAVVDLAQVLSTPPRAPVPDRLPPKELTRLRDLLAASGVKLRDGTGASDKLLDLRRLYEPYVKALSDFLLMSLPAFSLPADTYDNWQTSAWERAQRELPGDTSEGRRVENNFAEPDIVRFEYQGEEQQ